MANEIGDGQQAQKPQEAGVNSENTAKELHDRLYAISRATIGFYSSRTKLAELYNPDTINNLSFGQENYNTVGIHVTTPDRQFLQQQVRAGKTSREEFDNQINKLKEQGEALDQEGKSRGLVVNEIALEIIPAEDKMVKNVDGRFEYPQESVEEIFARPDVIKAIRTIDFLFDRSMVGWFVTMPRQDFDKLMTLVKTNELPNAFLSNQEMKRLKGLSDEEASYEMHRMLDLYKQSHPTESVSPDDTTVQIDEEAVRQPARYTLTFSYQKTGDLGKAIQQIEETYGNEETK